MVLERLSHAGRCVVEGGRGRIKNWRSAAFGFFDLGSVLGSRLSAKKNCNRPASFL